MSVSHVLVFSLIVWKVNGPNRIKIPDNDFPAIHSTTLRLQHYYFTQNHDTDEVYELYAIVCHKGQGVGYGHYIAYVKLENQWFWCNDKETQPCSRSRVLKEKPYLLFYAKVTDASNNKTNSVVVDAITEVITVE